jgi:hypothetical protein
MTAYDSRRAHRARQLLGLRADASIGEIDNAYRRLVRRLHPDTAPAAPPLATLAEAQAARELLRALARPTRHQEPPPTPRHDLPPPAPSRRAPDIRAGPVRYHGPNAPPT